jgi:GT2 family glycosyltransferase
MAGKTMGINISLVTYKSDKETVKRVIDCSLRTELIKKFYVIDNSPTDKLKELSTLDRRVVYIFNSKNMGFGKAHNIGIRKSLESGVSYHLVINPDVYFGESTIKDLYNYMDANPDVGSIMPKILYPSGETQYLAKLLPTPFDLIIRRFISFNNWGKKRDERYELRFSGYDKIMNVPNLSGCFMFLRIKALKEIGLFDENFFMYLEDTDLSRRMHNKYKTIFYPKACVFHEFAKGSYKNRKLLMIHIQSAIYYFNKWGWFFDNERDKINKAVMNDLKSKS